MTKIKICGLSRNEDISYVNEAKPDYVGFILHFPKSRRNISSERAATLRSRLAPGVKAVGVFVNQPVQIVAEAAALIGLDVIQLHGQEDDAYITDLREIIAHDAPMSYRQEDDAHIFALRKRGPCGRPTTMSWMHTSASGNRGTLPIWKAFKIRSAADLAAAEKSTADEILLDNGYGTGAAFAWSLLEGFHRPFMLAGGLTPENITDAIRTLRPKLVDISSGVETDGLKDRNKILDAVRAVRQF
ncbi:MAG: phosphoribosylanthranilate isomerase [Lachnospiraceae bacterium]|nr:phosphoribosylanthranilate isomerase [Lachnospiraceae bacterium]